MPADSGFDVRRRLLLCEEILHEGGPAPSRPQRRVAAVAVVRNPFANRYEPDLADVMSDLEPLGRDMATELVAAFGSADQVEGYGKGVIVGEDGELEHGALWHAPGGYAAREALGEALAIVPSSKKVGAAGARLDVPISHRHASYVRSHLDAMEVRVPDAPRPDELVLVLVMTDGGRVHARMGGLQADEITKWDGLR